MNREEDILDKNSINENGHGRSLSIQQCLSAMREHAKEEAIRFAEWVKTHWQLTKGNYTHKGDFYKNSKGVNIEQLYDLYLKSKTE